MDLKKLTEERLTASSSFRKKLVEGWMPYIGAIEEYNKAKGKESLSENDKQNIAQCLENTLSEVAMKGGQRLFENTTTQSDIAFLGIQLPVIAALLPSLVANKLAVVQALDRRQGAVFYLDVKYNNTKGSVTANTNMMSAISGHNSTAGGRLYGSQIVKDEAMTQSGTGSLLVFTKTCALLPLMGTLGSVTFTWVSGGATYRLTNSASALVLAGTYGAGTINSLAAGVVSVTIVSGYAPDNGTQPTITYQYNYETNTSMTGSIPGVNINLTSSTITALDFPLRADYTLGASIDLQKAHGLNLEDELVKYLGGEIKFELDHLVIDDMVQAGLDLTNGAGTAPSFSATVGSGQEWLWRKYQFVDSIEAGSNLIFSKTLRAFANFIICGNNVARVIRQLAPHFKPAAGIDGIVPTGPYELGTLDGRIVIHDPFVSTNTYTLGYKGDNYLMAGYIFAPYIPLMTTPTLLTADLKAQKGFLASAGFKLVNAGMFANGAISGLPA